MVSSNVLKEHTKSQASKNNHYTASNEREILLWIAQRCEFTLDVKEPIKAAYASVFSPLFPLSLSFLDLTQSEQEKYDKMDWLPQYRFNLINNCVGLDHDALYSFCTFVTARWQAAWLPGSTLVTDESVYEWLGTKCPVHVYIPRKPHPNGNKSEGISGYTAVLRLPYLLDLEPYLPGNKLTPRDACRRLVERTLANHPGLPLHLVTDSGFGSFEEAAYYSKLGVEVTMSMPSNQWSWLWDCLAYGCPLETGRTALVRLPDMHDNALASLYHTKSDSGKLIDIITLTTAFPYEPPEEEEERVVAVSNRRTGNNGAFEYETRWADGDVTWEAASQFMDTDGKFNILFLDFAKKEDIAGALDGLTNAELEAICDAQCWKVL